MESLINLGIDHFWAVVAVLFVPCLVGYIAWRNNRVIRFAAASGAFRSAFSDALLNLGHNSDLPTRSVVFNTHTRHLAAIGAFRPYIGISRRRSFKRAVLEYQSQADYYNSMGVLETFASEQTEDAQSAKARLVQAIQKLLSYASAT